MAADHRPEYRHSCCGAEASNDPSAKPGSHTPSSHGHKQPAHGQHAHEHGKESGSQSRAVQDGVKDPVCGMTVDPHATPHRGQYAGRTYYFCSQGCAAKFSSDPEKYLTKDDAKLPPVPEGTIYTCPMHPQIRQIGPGSCPICGMALEPE
ncbi:MAG: YHS domain-containing protein, partial [Xanthobacteraceae bacterium]